MFLKCQRGQHLTPNEQQVIDYINENIDKISDLTISEIADRAYVSASTISRAIRKCGLHKMSDMRYQAAISEIAKENLYVNEIFNAFHKECDKTIEKLDTSTILEAVKHIQKAKKIYVIASGSTCYIAERFTAQLQWLGYGACTQFDTTILERMNYLATSEDVVVVFTVANTHSILAEAAQHAKDVGAKVIVLSCVNAEPLAKVADVMMVGYRRKTDVEHILRLPSALSLMIMEHAITEYMIVEKLKE